MLHLSKKQFSPNSFTPVPYEYSLKLFKELEWIEILWENNLTQHKLLAKISEDGEVVMVMSPNTVFLNNEFINK